MKALSSTHAKLATTKFSSYHLLAVALLSALTAYAPAALQIVKLLCSVCPA
jgi:hypothetical protein